MRQIHLMGVRAWLISAILSIFLFPQSTSEWVKGNDRICNELKLCTPLGFTWRSDILTHYYNWTEACSAIEEAGIEEIFLYGDSYMRHILQALEITFTGDFDTGTRIL